MRRKEFEKIQMKLQELNKAQIVNDRNGVLTVRAYKSFLDQIKHQYQPTEARLVSQLINERLSEEANSQATPVFEIPVSSAIASDFGTVASLQR